MWMEKSEESAGLLKPPHKEFAFEGLEEVVDF